MEILQALSMATVPPGHKRLPAEAFTRIIKGGGRTIEKAKAILPIDGIPVPITPGHTTGVADTQNDLPSGNPQILHDLPARLG